MIVVTIMEEHIAALSELDIRQCTRPTGSVGAATGPLVAALSGG
jgi:hypothetical protein